MIVRKEAVPVQHFERCHDGLGTLLCQDMLPANLSKRGFTFFHNDLIPPGVSIGNHVHEGSEEIYYLLKGECTLVFDGQETPMHPGDFSLVTDGHSHGLINTGTEDAILIVVGLR